MCKTCLENNVKLLKDSKDSNKEKEMSCPWVRIFNFLDILFLLKLNFDLNAIQSKSQKCYFLIELGKYIPDCIWKGKKQEQPLKTKNVKGFALSDLRLIIKL